MKQFKKEHISSVLGGNRFISCRKCQVDKHGISNERVVRKHTFLMAIVRSSVKTKSRGKQPNIAPIIVNPTNAILEGNKDEDFPGGSVLKNLLANAGDIEFDP